MPSQTFHPERFSVRPSAARISEMLAGDHLALLEHRLALAHASW